MPRPPRGRRTTVGAAVVAVVVILAAAIILEMRGSRRFTALLDAAPSGADPAEALSAAGRSRRFLFIADIPGSAAPDRLAATVLENLASGVGLDALVVGVGDDQQVWIDQYLQSDPEDASPLVAHPASVGGAGTPLLELYRSVWRVNRQVGAARSVRIVAADLPAGARSQSLAPGQLAARAAERDAHMERAVDDRIIAREPRARVLFLLDGLHTLRVPYVLRTGGAAPVEVRPLAARLSEREPREVWSALIDPAPTGSVTAEMAAYSGTAAREFLRREESVLGSFSVRTLDSFGQASEWITVATRPGASVTLVPASVPLSDVVDTYVYLQN
jgi:hypothetical protein